MKSLSNIGHFIIFDLTKLGAAYQIINSVVDGDNIKTFEISPLGSQAVLILVTKDLISAQLILNQCMSLYKSDITDAVVVENVEQNILGPYLSQNLPKMNQAMLIVEINTFAKAFAVAKRFVNAEINIIEFRVIRTGPPSLVLVATDENAEKLNSFMQVSDSSKMTLITGVQLSVSSLFQITT